MKEKAKGKDLNHDNADADANANAIKRVMRNENGNNDWWRAVKYEKTKGNYRPKRCYGDNRKKSMMKVSQRCCVASPAAFFCRGNLKRLETPGSALKSLCCITNRVIRSLSPLS